jgi:transposase
MRPSRARILTARMRCRAAAIIAASLSGEWKRLYRGRAAVEREFGRLKNEYGLTPLRTRGLDRVRLHAALVMIARLGQALVRARAVPFAA